MKKKSKKKEEVNSHVFIWFFILKLYEWGWTCSVWLPIGLMKDFF